MRVERFRHHWISVGQYGRAIRLFRAENCRDLIFIGTLVLRHTDRQASLIEEGWEEVPIDAIRDVDLTAGGHRLTIGTDADGIEEILCCREIAGQAARWWAPRSGRFLLPGRAR